MKTSSIFILLLFLTYNSLAQTRAVTENGDEVLLNTDGTWNFVNSDLIEPEHDVKLNPSSFSKPITATFLVKSEKVKIGIWLDSKKWSFKKGNEEVYEFQIAKKAGDVYGMVITEKIEIPISELKKIAFDNAKAAAPDIKLIKEEYRIVNGIKMLFLQMDGTIQGIKFTYLGYYYSNESGTVQFLTYTSQKLMKEQSAECESLLNGLVQIK